MRIGWKSKTTVKKKGNEKKRKGGSVRRKEEKERRKEKKKEKRRARKSGQGSQRPEGGTPDLGLNPASVKSRRRLEGPKGGSDPSSFWFQVPGFLTHSQPGNVK